MSFIIDPAEIEKKSFEIISKKLVGRRFDPDNINVVKRVIHTTADFDYADNLFFSDGAAAIAKMAIRKGVDIVTDTRMAMSGINRKAADCFGCALHCYIGEQETVESAKSAGSTRAYAAVGTAVAALARPAIFAVGNAPTALLRLYELIEEGKVSPVLIIAVPVGFVNVVEAKELITGLRIPHIVAKGQKGGSAVAAAICNALLYDAADETQT